MAEATENQLTVFLSQDAEVGDWNEEKLAPLLLLLRANGIERPSQIIGVNFEDLTWPPEHGVLAVGIGLLRRAFKRANTVRGTSALVARLAVFICGDVGHASTAIGYRQRGCWAQAALGRLRPSRNCPSLQMLIARPS